MLVSNWMSAPVITIEAEDSMQEAITLLKENNIRILPVMKNKKLVGVITDRDLKRASASDATSLEIHELFYLISKIKVKSIMTRNPITVSPDFSIEETAQILIKNKISAVPVVDENGRVVGIITQTDLFRILTNLTGVYKKGVQFAFVIKDHPGSIKQITDIVRSYGGQLVSILASYQSAPPGYRNLYVRAQQIDRARLPKLIEDLKKAATMRYMIDHRENIREMYVTQ
ncbi:MAG: CBS and ACT domain-containing protein [Pseudomonadota bacterium]